MKRTSRHQSPPRSDHPFRKSRSHRRSRKRTSDRHHTRRYRTASEEDSSNDRGHHKERTSEYPTKSHSSRTRVRCLQSPRVNSIRHDDRRDRTCRLKSPLRYRSGKSRKHSDSSSSSDNEHRAFDRTESKRCHNASKRRPELYASSDEDDEEIAVRGRHRIRLRTFDGSGTFETLWAHFENCALYNRWNNADKLAHLKASLVGDAGQVLWDSDPSSVNTLSKLVQLLKARFEGSRQADKHRMEFRLRRRKSGETLTELHRDIRRLMALAHLSLTETARKEIACDYFVDALDNPDFALKVRERAPATLDDTLRIALQLEAWTKDVQRKTEEREKHKFKTCGSEVTESTLETRLSRLETQLVSFQPSSKTARPERQRPTARSATTATPSNKTPELDLKRLKEQIENDIRESLKAEIREEMQRDLERKQPLPSARPAVTSRSEQCYGGPPASTLPYMEILGRAIETIGIIEKTTVTTNLYYAGIVAFQDIFDETVFCLCRLLIPLEPRMFRNLQGPQRLLEDPR